MLSNTTNLPRVRSYEEALAHWEKTSEPAVKSRDASIWEAYQRPLDTDKGGNHKWHYRIEKDGEAFNVCLYNTVMARYERPEGDTRVVYYAGDSRMTSSAFMWNVLATGFLRKQVTTEETEVAVPIGYDRRLDTKLTFIDGKLDVSRSTHPVMCTLVMSEENKKLRKELRETLVPFVDAMELQIPVFEESATVDTAKWNKSPFIKIDGALCETAPGDDGWSDKLFEYAQAVYNSLLTRAYRRGAPSLAPTPEVFLRALERNVLKELGANNKDRLVELPLFLEWHKYPKSAVRM